MTLQPHESAALDQDLAAIVDLVTQIRAHWTAGCYMPGICPGRPVIRTLTDRCPAARNSLLVAALVQLAQAPGTQAGPTEGNPL